MVGIWEDFYRATTRIRFIRCLHKVINDGSVRECLSVRRLMKIFRVQITLLWLYYPFQFPMEIILWLKLSQSVERYKISSTIWYLIGTTEPASNAHDFDNENWSASKGRPGLILSGSRDFFVNKTSTERHSLSSCNLITSAVFVVSRDKSTNRGRVTGVKSPDKKRHFHYRLPESNTTSGETAIFSNWNETERTIFCRCNCSVILANQWMILFIKNIYTQLWDAIAIQRNIIQWRATGSLLLGSSLSRGPDFDHRRLCHSNTVGTYKKQLHVFHLDPESTIQRWCFVGPEMRKNSSLHNVVSKTAIVPSLCSR